MIDSPPNTPTRVPPKSDCPHCGDTGRAWYYHEPAPTGRRKKRRTWTAEEAFALPAPLFLTLRCTRNAICSCAAGKSFRNTNLYQSQGHQFTSLERVQQLAAERRQWEGVEVGPEGQP